MNYFTDIENVTYTEMTRSGDGQTFRRFPDGRWEYFGAGCWWNIENPVRIDEYEKEYQPLVSTSTLPHK